MSRGAPWCGFDYTSGKEVTLSRDEWAQLRLLAAREQRVGGDLTLFDQHGRITHEIYDKEKG